MSNQTLYREIRCEAVRADAKARTVELSFSSEYPVERHFGVEILDHSPKSVDLTRLNNAGPVLVDHDTTRQVGVIVKSWLEGRRGKALVRFGNGQLASEIFQDVKDGIRQLVSVGYRLNETVREKVEKGIETLRAISWTPLEISIVSVPADPNVGIGRSLEGRTSLMEIKTSAAEEIESIAAILRRRGVSGVDEIATRAITSGQSVEDFRQAAFKLLPTVTPIKQAEPLDVKPKDWARYSITRALRMQIPGERRDGLEAELSDECTLKAGQRAAGVWIPREALVPVSRNFVAGTGTLGGMLVETQNLGSQFVELLRNRAKTVELGARVINLGGPVTIPRQNAAGSANWLSETQAVTLSTGNFTALTLTPLGLSCFQQYSKQLLFESDPSIDSLIRDDIMQILALAIDAAVLHGTGSGQPTGITATTGVTTIALAADGSAFSVANGFASMVSLETAVANANADGGLSMAYLTNSRMRGRLKRIDENLTTTAAKWVWTGGVNDSKVNGYRAEVSNQVSAIQTQGTATTISSSVFFGNWQDVMIANFGPGIDLVVDPYTLAVNGVTRIIARQWVDIGIRHPASFAVLLGCLDA